MTITTFTSKTQKPLAIALGFFDSVHIGHRAVISRAVEYAKINGIMSAVLTFENNPMQVLGKKERLIFTFEERLKKLENLGVDLVIKQVFDHEFMNQDKAIFIDELLNNNKIRFAVCGNDYHFGKGGQGDINYLYDRFSKQNIEFKVMDFVLLEQSKVSSSAIRKMIENGEVNKANELLVEPYFLTGKVIRGRGEGRRFGLPTININYESDKVIPLSGVYISKTMIDNQSFVSVTSVGTKPTFSDNIENVETHILNYQGNLYDKQVKIEFYQYLRSIKKYQTKELLTNQIKQDIKATKIFFNGEKRYD